MRRLLYVLAVLLLLLGAAAGLARWFHGRLVASLPQLDGEVRIVGLAAPVLVERDSLGVPTLTAANRVDLARALGFLHAQDRFFQMDLMRRRAAGELAELFGKAALPLDRANRPNGFRALARIVVSQATPEQRAVIEAYASGVNAGLAALRAKPFEYYVLRASPVPWKPEDCALVAYSMLLTLQESNGNYERSLSTLRDIYGPRAVAFFAPLATPSDAALDNSTAPLAPIPGPQFINIRREVTSAHPPPRGSGGLAASFNPAPSLDSAPVPPPDTVDTSTTPGSNSFAFSGARTETHSALVANDMHLELSVPNTWYRARLRSPHSDLTGVTLPGTPFLVAGSNGHIAWGLTNAQVDTSDLIVVTPTESPDLYLAPLTAGVKDYEHRRDVIHVKGGADVTVDSTWTIFGRIVGTNGNDRPLALHWTAYDPRATNFDYLELESATTAAQAVTIAHHLGVPALNFLVGDSAGHIAWTIAGFLPRRVGYDGRFPVTWDYGDRSWDGYLPSSEVPTVDDPNRSCLWTANNRILGGKALALLGDGAYERPARAAQIRDDLAHLHSTAKPADCLSFQLDDRALFLSRWRTLLLDTLTASDEARGPLPGSERAARARRALIRAAVLHSWDGRASTSSSGYRIVRAFRRAVIERVLTPIFAPCVDANPSFSWRRFHYEDAVWALVHLKPMNLLSPSYFSWDQLLLEAVDDLSKSLGNPEQATWGRRNTLHMVHPFARVAPSWLVSSLNMPAEELPGDTDMPRVQSPTFGASERFAVSPGHESEGIFEMPGGQSGHPLSPYYRAGHEAWAHGRPTPFLPGPPEHRLELIPSR